MRLSGPVDAVKIDFHGRQYLLLSDRHNSTQGSCPGMCADISPHNKTVKGRDACETVLHFLDRHLQEGADFFLEASYVTRDSPRPKLKKNAQDGFQTFDYGDSKEITNFDLDLKRSPRRGFSESDFDSFDYIDRMLYVFHESFLRNKKLTQYPKSYLHYVDIRDVFAGTYNENGTREMISANPFSGSIVVKAFRECDSIPQFRQVYQEGVVLVKYILDHAWDYYNSFVSSDKRFPIPNNKGAQFDEFRERLARRDSLTSQFHGVRISRVAKQLFKLKQDLRERIETWAKAAFQKELEISKDIFEEWTIRMEELLSQNPPQDVFLAKFEPVRMHPISCLVALSSIIMDIYLLARSFYHTNTELTVFYCGAAHIENHIQFFEKYGGTILQKSNLSPQLERCIVLS